MNIHSASVQEINDTIYRHLYSLNYRENGYMREVLKKCKHGDPEFYDGEVAYIMEHGQVLAWSLVFKHRRGINTQHIVHVYTRKSHRKKGFGSQLMDFWTNHYNNLRGHHDNSSVFQRHAVRKVMLDYTYGLK
jgi:GNAT superfamily N-acetyltransferase